jgi:hypothetical protein
MKIKKIEYEKKLDCSKITELDIYRNKTDTSLETDVVRTR